jgi:hypothetical protein
LTRIRSVGSASYAVAHLELLRDLCSIISLEW